MEDLYGKTIGIAGLGNIGLEIAKRSKSFGMRVIGSRRNSEFVPLRLPGYEQFVDEVLSPNQLEKLVSAADIVVDALPLTSETHEIFNYEIFSKFKRSSIFVNVGRGQTVIENDLIRSLKEGLLKGAALDVFNEEPLPDDSPLWGMNNVIVSPHVSGWSPDYVGRAVEILKENLTHFARGDQLTNIVNKDAGY